MDDATKNLEERASSRRAILVGALGGIGAWAAGALGRPAPARADDDPIETGGSYLTQSPTELRNLHNGAIVLLAQQVTGGPGFVGWSGPQGSSTNPLPSSSVGVYGRSTMTNGVGVHAEAPAASGTGIEATGRVGVFGTSITTGWMAIWGRHFGAGYGVAGDSLSGVGVSAASDATDQPGLLARSRGNSAGVLGFSGGLASAAPAAPSKTGVFGQATQDAGSRGVWGKATSGEGIRGEATSGVGLAGNASSAAGYGIRTSGRVRFDKVCGVATLAAGTTSKVITPGTDVTADSFVLLTPGADIGTRRLWFTKDTTANTITIRMSSSRTSSTPISWLLLR